jgi:hypothetical protein
MWRRLYLTFPNSDQARKASSELEHDSVKREQMHAMNSEGGQSESGGHLVGWTVPGLRI